MEFEITGVTTRKVRCEVKSKLMSTIVHYALYFNNFSSTDKSKPVYTYVDGAIRILTIIPEWGDDKHTRDKLKEKACNVVGAFLDNININTAEEFQEAYDKSGIFEMNNHIRSVYNKSIEAGRPAWLLAY